MGEELFTIVFILLIVLASIFDAVARGKRKKQQKERMESEEAGEGVAFPEEAGVATEERQTADTMVPDDLWAILTGGQPRPAEREPEPELEPEPEPELWEAERDPLPPREPHLPVPLPQDRMSKRPAAEAAPEDLTAPTRRSSRWMEGIGGREERELPPTAIEADEARVYEAPPEPWDQFDDISAGEIREGEGLVVGIGDDEADAGLPRRRRARRGRGADFTRLLESGHLKDLRTGVVLMEVLGPPAAFRGPGPEWER